VQDVAANTATCHHTIPVTGIGAIAPVGRQRSPIALTRELPTARGRIARLVQTRKDSPFTLISRSSAPSEARFSFRPQGRISIARQPLTV